MNYKARFICAWALCRRELSVSADTWALLKYRNEDRKSTMIFKSVIDASSKVQ
jgi:hypothetical protein